MADSLTELREHLATVADLRNASLLLGWDQNTMMPARGAPARAESLATLERIRHERFISERTGELLAAATENLNGADPDGDDARLLAVTRRQWEKARRVPSALAADMARAGSIGQEVWAAARAKKDFAAFAPCLERNLELARRYVECFSDFERPYDVLLDDYEAGMRSAVVASLFDELKSELVPMVGTLDGLGDRVPDAWLHERVSIERQRELVDAVLSMMGFDRAGWRLDDTVHPFATGLGSGDVRITTRWEETYFPMALFGAMHECGHGLYEEGIAASLQRTPLGHGESLGLHESQSRMWENMVGRGRPFSHVLAPEVARRLGGPLSEITPEVLYRAVNRVQPSFIRVEADEVTYNLHIIIRFELEQELIEGRLGVAELPEAWNARYREYLVLEVPDDAMGVLQDVHWAAGLIGYFPTYALGNLIAGTLWEQVRAELVDLDTDIAAGRLAPLREWLREHVHRHGAKFTATELVQARTGHPIRVGPLVSYLKTKLGDVYGVEL